MASSRILAVCSCLLVIRVANASANRELVAKLPHLEYSNPTSILLAANEIWRPGMQTLLTALTFDRPLTVELNVTQYQVPPIVPPVMHLLYKCSNNDTSYQAINISHGIKIDSSIIYCEQSKSFSLTKLYSSTHLSRFNLTLIPSYQLPFNVAMNHTLELCARVQFWEGTERSASLFVYNLDSLRKLNSAPSASSGNLVTRHILSIQGANFLSSLEVPNGTKPTSSVSLLDQPFVDAVKHSPLFIRPMLSVSVLLIGDGSPCDSKATVKDRIVFTSGDSDIDIAQFLFEQPNYFIDIYTGVLTYSQSSLRKNLADLMKSKSFIRICIRISLNPAVWNYRLNLQVAELPVKVSMSSGGAGSITAACSAYQGRSARWVTLSVGMQDAILMSPVVCSDRTKEVSKVSFNDIECTNYLDMMSHKWQSCGHYLLSQYGNAVLLDGPVSLAHEGLYKFSVSDTVFVFYVSVVSMPMFDTLSDKGSLPHVTYANLDLSVTFNCTAYHDSMKYVTIESFFRVLDPLQPGSTWQEMSLDDFAIKVLRTAPSSVQKHSSKLNSVRTAENLRITMPIVTVTWKTWRLAFICRARVDPSDVYRMGLTHYSVETRTDVVYYGQRIAASSQSPRLGSDFLVILLAAVWSAAFSVHFNFYV